MAGWGHGCCWRDRDGVGGHGWKMGAGPGSAAILRAEEFSALISGDDLCNPSMENGPEEWTALGRPSGSKLGPFLRKSVPASWEALSASQNLSLTSRPTAILGMRSGVILTSPATKWKISGAS